MSVAECPHDYNGVSVKGGGDKLVGLSHLGFPASGARIVRVTHI
jgi:hypothetical protein